jgi:hypothetical protein
MPRVVGEDETGEPFEYDACAQPEIENSLAPSTAEARVVFSAGA